MATVEDGCVETEVASDPLVAAEHAVVPVVAELLFVAYASTACLKH